MGDTEKTSHHSRRSKRGFRMFGAGLFGFLILLFFSLFALGKNWIEYEYTNILVQVSYTAMTAIYVLVSLGLYRETATQSNLDERLAEIEKRQTKILDKQAKLEHDPVLTIDAWQVRDGHVKLTLSNVGRGIAKNISLATHLSPFEEDYEPQVPDIDSRALVPVNREKDESGPKQTLRPNECNVTVTVKPKIRENWRKPMFLSGFHKAKRTLAEKGAEKAVLQFVIVCENSVGEKMPMRVIWSQKIETEDESTLSKTVYENERVIWTDHTVFPEDYWEEKDSISSNYRDNPYSDFAADPYSLQ